MSSYLQLLVSGLQIFGCVIPLACGRHHEVAPQNENGPHPTGQHVNATGPGQPTRAAGEDDSGVEDRRLLDELESHFANDSDLAASEKRGEETKITQAFASFKSVTFLEPVQCKEKLCRLTIKVPSSADLNQVLGAMVGVPRPDNPGGTALLPYSLTNPAHRVLPDGTVTATVFIRKVRWEVLRGNAE